MMHQPTEDLRTYHDWLRRCGELFSEDAPHEPQLIVAGGAEELRRQTALHVLVDLRPEHVRFPVDHVGVVLRHVVRVRVVTKRQHRRLLGRAGIVLALVPGRRSAANRSHGARGWRLGLGPAAEREVGTGEGNGRDGPRCGV